MARSLARLDAGVGVVLRTSACLMLALLMLLVGANVVGRALGLPEVAWVGEGVEILFAWMVFLGAAELWRVRGHFAVDLLAEALPAGLPRRILQLLVATASLGFALALLWYGTSLTLSATALTPILELPTALGYASLPVAAAVMAAASLRDMIALLHAAPSATELHLNQDREPAR